jgi:hypothetical protein
MWGINACAATHKGKKRWMMPNARVGRPYSSNRQSDALTNNISEAEAVTAALSLKVISSLITAAEMVRLGL